jgi:hypothetical protein
MGLFSITGFRVARPSARAQQPNAKSDRKESSQATRHLWSAGSWFRFGQVSAKEMSRVSAASLHPRLGSAGMASGTENGANQG